MVFEANSEFSLQRAAEVDKEVRPDALDVGVLPFQQGVALGQKCDGRPKRHPVMEGREEVRHRPLVPLQHGLSQQRIENREQ